VLVIRSMTVLTCALVNLAKDRTNPWGNRCAGERPLFCAHTQMQLSALCPSSLRANMLMWWPLIVTACLPDFHTTDMHILPEPRAFVPIVSISPSRRKLLTLRGFLGFGGNGGYFWTVTLLPLNDAVVLTFLAPAWVAILSPLLLRERPGKFTWFAIPVGAVIPGLQCANFHYVCLCAGCDS
jgi:drug/metabolite transporter (DMT)-like permease